MMGKIYRLVIVVIIAVVTGLLLLAFLEVAEKNSVKGGREKHKSGSYKKVRLPSYVNAKEI